MFDNYRCFYILFQRKKRRESPVVSQKVVLADRGVIGGAFANTSGFVSNAVVGQAVDDRRRSFFQRFFLRRKTVKPEDELVGPSENGSGKKRLSKFSFRRKSNAFEEGAVQAQILSSMMFQNFKLVANIAHSTVTHLALLCDVRV